MTNGQMADDTGRGGRRKVEGRRCRVRAKTRVRPAKWGIYDQQRLWDGTCGMDGPDANSCEILRKRVGAGGGRGRKWAAGGVWRNARFAMEKCGRRPNSRPSNTFMVHRAFMENYGKICGIMENSRRGGEGQSADGQALAGREPHDAWVDDDANWAGRNEHFDHVTTERDVYDEEFRSIPGFSRAITGILISWPDKAFGREIGVFQKKSQCGRMSARLQEIFMRNSTHTVILGAYGACDAPERFRSVMRIMRNSALFSENGG